MKYTKEEITTAAGYTPIGETLLNLLFEKIDELRLERQQNNGKPIVGGSYLYQRMMQIINNPEPLSKPHYSCPMSAYGKSKDCQFPNCTCEWRL